MPAPQGGLTPSLRHAQFQVQDESEPVPVARKKINEAECLAQYKRDIFHCNMVGLSQCYAQAMERYSACLNGIRSARRRQCPTVTATHEFDVEEPEMSRDAAKKIIDLMVRHGAEQNATLAEIRSVCADDEFQRYKRMIGRSMGSMLLDVINPIVELYPDLKPAQLE